MAPLAQIALELHAIATRIMVRVKKTKWWSRLVTKVNKAEERALKDLEK